MRLCRNDVDIDRFDLKKSQRTRLYKKQHRETKAFKLLGELDRVRILADFIRPDIPYDKIPDMEVDIQHRSGTVQTTTLKKIRDVATIKGVNLNKKAWCSGIP